MRNLLESITTGDTLILDGGMGSLLAQLGGSMRSGENNLLYPDVVRQVHSLYAQAGCDAITTNTFALNGVYADKQGMSDTEREKSLRAAMEIAVSVCEGKYYLLADLGPSGEMLAPLGKGDPDVYYTAFYTQAKLMAEYPIDAFIIETVFDLAEALIIIKACRESAPQIPVLLSMTFSSLKKGGCTIMGSTAAQIAAAAEKEGAAAVGANCGDLTPMEYSQIIASMKEACQLPLLVQPNAGMPKLEGGKAVYSLGPEEFAAQLQGCYDAGARLLGGCCGTTPEHIAALVRQFKDKS